MPLGEGLRWHPKSQQGELIHKMQRQGTRPCPVGYEWAKIGCVRYVTDIRRACYMGTTSRRGFPAGEGNVGS